MVSNVARFWKREGEKERENGQVEDQSGEEKSGGKELQADSPPEHGA